jgi:hypothetical protein
MKKANVNVVHRMREQYKYAKEQLQPNSPTAEMLEHETILWERHLDASLRSDVKKGTFPKVVDLMLYKRVKEAWLARLNQENRKDGNS